MTVEEAVREAGWTEAEVAAFDRALGGEGLEVVGVEGNGAVVLAGAGFELDVYPLSATGVAARREAGIGGPDTMYLETTDGGFLVVASWEV